MKLPCLRSMALASRIPIQGAQLDDTQVDTNEASMCLRSMALASRIPIQGAQLDDTQVDTNEASMSPFYGSGQ